MRTHLPPRPATLLLLGAALLLLAAPAALADHTMPNVVGRAEALAVQELESLGLTVHVVTIAGAPAGRVAAQSPEPGAPVQEGDEVELRVGVLVNVETVVPSALGMTEERAVAALETAYFLQVEYVTGPRGMQGRVVRQSPEAGARALLRSVLTLSVVRTHVIVPLLVGRTQDAARDLLDQAGLEMHVRYVRSQFAERGTVFAQQPAPGVRLLPGGAVEVTVAGRHGGGHADRVKVPEVVGLRMHDAEEEILGAGLVPHVHFVTGRPHPAWTVVSQEVPAGRRVKEGSHVGIDVVKPGRIDGDLRTPALHGLTRDDVIDLLGHLGLAAEFLVQPSRLPVGTVIAQAPEPGEPIATGGTLRLTLAGEPPAGWGPQRVSVPDVTGLRAIDAHLRLITAGLRPRMGRDTGAGQPVERVFRQAPAAGSRVAVGDVVEYFVPFRASMPDLMGKTRTQALQDIQDAGLTGMAQRLGPAISGGISEVIWQQHTAGTTIARGTLVRFRYRMTPPPAALRAVPDVVGLSKEDAAARLTSAGFRAELRAASIGVGQTRVISQSPVAGALRPIGHTVQATYRYVGPVLPVFQVVPAVIGQTLPSAKARLEGLGFRVSTVRQGLPGIAGSPTEVIAQSPVGGTRLARGANVTITYRHRIAIGPGVRVPNVVGMRLDKAMDALRAAGLSWSLNGLGSRVRSQSPAAGALVRPGNTVTLRLRF